jgi:hypothetical protein
MLGHIICELVEEKVFPLSTWREDQAENL